MIHASLLTLTSIGYLYFIHTSRQIVLLHGFIKKTEFKPSNPYRSDNNYPGETVQDQYDKLSVNHGPTSVSSDGSINGNNSGTILGEPVYV